MGTVKESSTTRKHQEPEWTCRVNNIKHNGDGPQEHTGEQTKNGDVGVHPGSSKNDNQGALQALVAGPAAEGATCWPRVKGDATLIRGRACWPGL